MPLYKKKREATLNPITHDNKSYGLLALFLPRRGTLLPRSVCGHLPLASVLIRGVQQDHHGANYIGWLLSY